MRLPEEEPQALVSQPGDPGLRLVEPGGDQQRVVGALLVLHDDFLLGDRDSRRGFDEVAEQVAGLGRLVTVADADRQEATTFVSASAFLCRDGRRRSRDLCAAAPSGTSQGAAQCAAGRRFWSRLASALVSSNRRLRTAASGIRL